MLATAAAHDHADWCDAFFTVREGAVLKPLPRPPTEQMGILTPTPPRAPRINGRARFRRTAGQPRAFHDPGQRRAPRHPDRGWPAGGTFSGPRARPDQGAVANAGSYRMTFRAANAHGTAARDWRLEVGERIALTPPMGWNSWNCFAHTVSDTSIRAAARAMVESGLVRHGWSYVNIDDYWQTCPGERTDTSLMGPARDSAGRILPNARFPDMPRFAAMSIGSASKSASIRRRAPPHAADASGAGAMKPKTRKPMPNGALII
jgi:alpha-galactosidase